MNSIISVCCGSIFLVFTAACSKPPVQSCQGKKEYCLKELAVNATDTIIVCAVNPRNHSGILLKRGCSYNFEVIPPDQTWMDGPKLKPFTADGKTQFKVLWGQLFIKKPFVSWYALLGSIDNKHSTYFKIGVRHDNYCPKRDGELICFANDGIGCNDYWYRHNNEGQMTVVITRIK
ncbi:MAG: hypothetical protein JWO44_1616 [Bacteroidetes bacterium]|jgi:hypothetical protein|nr:hypothetical protein [Bacteroidota bacterium]